MENILVVDDEAEIWKICQHTLERKGYMVHTAPSADHALELFKSVVFDIAFVDLRMPGRMDGIELLKYIRENHPDTKAIVVTAEDAIRTAIECLRVGAFDYILKPFQLSELLNSAKLAWNYSCSRGNKCVENSEYLKLYPGSGEESVSSEEMLKSILDMAVKELKADEGSIHMYLPRKKTLKLLVATGTEAERENEIKLGERVVSWVAKNREPLLIHDEMQDFPQFKELTISSELSSSIIIPLIRHETFLGEICLSRLSTRTNKRFTKDDLLSLQRFAIHTSLVMLLQ
ncbi:MAG TPA: hypothetical protein DEE98_08705 [Elusimicrobia bacterium]|nr:MAG: hypothetical protein A2278_05295 [Elusimicrobia bacterium RIFOXYA12_FULL_49_49]OGS09435.1 MAG: hypothetical protein A2204_01965 [Elusimicrobia bacterium RIFOXYA1_FULL_47_7]OGS11396.1 MAG: hypothetical protein A2386_06345 [Elusimicrobia bacterium RIFOXYB1_FULL_48_9]OGS16505.1 MAG: hypothetical protein A2251_06765 [Elusimicrobia bacterium RIFOXYA2_FULL_47_53]OGS25900.1 MAG: hypothetical protein A2339_00780 [Elusimicrobia bacterium RIFOXYB12_FULL_50_12]OGS31242.1 MAG: hypothetical protein